MAAAVVLLADFLTGLRTRRLTTTQVSAHRTLAILIVAVTGFALGGRHPTFVPIVVSGLCFLIMLLTPRGRAAASRWDPIARRTPAPVPADGGTPGTPASISLAGVDTAVSWHLPGPVPGALAGDPDRRAAWAVLGNPADLRHAPPKGARIDYDTDVWFKAPYDPVQYDAWVQAALTHATRRFGVTGDSAEGLVLGKLLTEFVQRDVGTPNRLLRLGEALGSVPLVATFSVLTGLPESTTGHIFDSYLPDRGYVDAPRTKVLDPSRQLVRALRQTKNGSDDATMSVRYHRPVADLGTDVMLACEGGQLVASSQALSDIDALAASVWVLDSDGRRR